MPASYDPALSRSVDRVRLLIDDRKGPWRYEDEEISALLGEDPSESIEIRVAIQLLEAEQEGSMVSQTRRQGSWSNTKTVMARNEARIAALRHRLALAETTDDVDGVSVGEMEFPEPEDFPVVRPAWP